MSRPVDYAGSAVKLTPSSSAHDIMSVRFVAVNPVMDPTAKVPEVNRKVRARTTMVQL